MRTPVTRLPSQPWKREQGKGPAGSTEGTPRYLRGLGERTKPRRTQREKSCLKPSVVQGNHIRCLPRDSCPDHRKEVSRLRLIRGIRRLLGCFRLVPTTTWEDCLHAIAGEGWSDTGASRAVDGAQRENQGTPQWDVNRDGLTAGSRP